KSTLVEAFAAVYPRHGAESSSRLSVTGPGTSDEDSPLRWHLKAQTHGLAAPGGFFLRAEAMHAYLSEIDGDPAERRARGEEGEEDRAHGDAVLAGVP